MKRILLALTAMLAVTGCTHFHPRRPRRTAVVTGLAGTHWRLAAIHQGHTVTVPPRELDYTLDFGVDGTLGGQFDCNVARGTYTASAGALTIGPIALTRAMCPAPDLSPRLAADLPTATSYSLTRGELVLALRDHRGTYVFAPVSR